MLIHNSTKVVLFIYKEEGEEGRARAARCFRLMARLAFLMAVSKLGFGIFCYAEHPSSGYPYYIGLYITGIMV